MADTYKIHVSASEHGPADARVTHRTHEILPADEAPDTWECPALADADMVELLECLEDGARKGRPAAVKEAVTWARSHALHDQIVDALRYHLRR